MFLFFFCFYIHIKKYTAIYQSIDAKKYWKRYITMTYNDMVPYIYGIVANINFVLSQIFFKMLTVVIPPSVVLSFQAFFLLIFNTFVIVSNK